jgi:hypothetical protein
VKKEWKACDHGDYSDNGGECIAIIGDNVRVALVLGRDIPETHENAALIVAAPEMLSAVEAALALLQDPDATDTDADKVEALLEGAIAKAKGEA